MTVYIGVDFHARKQMLSYLTTEDGEIQQIELLHEQDDIRGFYAQLRSQGPVIVGFESSGYAAWFEEMLEELGCEIWIGHAAVIRKCARRRQKNDRRDAELILELMLRGDFPRIHRYSRQNREVLQQLRYRQPRCIGGKDAHDGYQQPALHGRQSRSDFAGEAAEPTGPGPVAGAGSAHASGPTAR